MAKKKAAAAAEQAPETTQAETATPNLPVASSGNPLAELGLDGFSGLEDFGKGDFIVPRVKIVQPTSKEGTAGTFRNNLSGEEFTRITIIGVKIERGRVLWSDDNNDEPLCRSFDGLVPDPALTSPQCAKCADPSTTGLKPVCPRAQWVNDPKTGKNNRPDCDETLSLLAINLDGDNAPFWLQVSGMSLKPFKRLISTIALRKKKLFQFKTEFFLSEAKSDKGRYYAIDFTPPVLVEHEELVGLADIITSLKDISIRKTFEHEDALKAASTETQGAEPSASSDIPDWVNE